MATLIFDIETVGEAWEDLDESTQATLTRWADRTARDDHERNALYADIKAGLGFSPLTGAIVAIGLYDLERRQGAVYYQGAGDEADTTVGDYTLKERTEREMLADFWEGARSYDTFVTFNGRSFDVPFLLLRSIAAHVKPTADLMRGRYLYQQTHIRHVDLLDQLTFYGAMHRKPNLHLFCRAFGIASPKTAGVAGDDVAGLFYEKRFEDIARYNVRDVVATTALYEKWLEYLAPAEFLDTSMQ